MRQIQTLALALLATIGFLVLAGCADGMNIGAGGGIVGLIILILDIYAIVKIVGSAASVGMKILWVLIVLFLPVLGLILWFFLGPK